ncbi:GGDEF domain-containing protein [Streptomyces odontomachi]|uniref:GGDEF domain-containing protein n=1 Tax=Streptomyces odontomachi TaxID=2944940 RepID=UPI00210CBBB7|nr:sensor domain-containing diguanylate cyclase [Streptomyces sp. ODS25]
MPDDARLQAVVDLARGMAAAHSPQHSWHAAADGARRALNGSFAALSVWERDLGRLRVLVNVGERAPGEEEFPRTEAYPVHQFPEITEFLHERWTGGGEPRAWTATAGEGTGPDGDTGFAAPAPRPSARSWGRAAALRRRGRGACVVAPIMLNGRAWGELYVARPVGAPVFDRADADFATVLASVVAAGLAQTERLEEARRLAFTDALTGLANRRAVDMRLDEAIESHRRAGDVVSLVVCDLNGLKQVNDTQGHAVGDRLLERFGSVLSLCGAMLPGALAARLGGDEFCLLAVGPTSDDVVRVAEEVCRRAAELRLGEGVACGVASTGDPIGPMRSSRWLFRLADAAQYRAKAARAAAPVVAGRAGPDDPVVRLADARGAPRAGERRRIRGLRPPHT